jgi:DNA modification methylase
MGKNARTFGQDLMRGEGQQRNGLTWTGTAVAAESRPSSTEASGTSIFDPVLCELVYRWFCPAGGTVLDPFAGGSVRGIVASKLGLRYKGLDLSERQIEENRRQAAEICTANQPTWILGDSRNTCSLAAGGYDLIFSCPPYGDLEVYSDDERALSTLDYPGFLAAYREIIGRCAAMLKPDCFACFVVGDFRDRQGFYRNFVSETIAAFESAGVRLYNEAILVTAVGSLPIRIGKQFGRYRKLGKTHQNVLVFYNGQPKSIPETFGECDFGEINQAEESAEKALCQIQT